jgi:Tfp pilus assembly protein PilX
MTHRPSIHPSHGERGFALVTVIALMAVVMLFSVGAFAAVNGDLPGSGEDVTRKQAENAAEVGIADFQAQLNADSSSWTKCTDGGPALNDPWKTRTPPATTKWATVPGSTTQYAIELLPARGSGYDKCDADPNKVVASMIDPAARGLRIRVTGKAKGSQGEETRSVIATYRRMSFLDYLWFTDYEAADPSWAKAAIDNRATSPQAPQTDDLPTWAVKGCARYFRPAPAGKDPSGFGRAGYVWTGRIDIDGDGSATDTDIVNGFPGSYGPVSYSCDSLLAIRFASNDKLLGPMHTNDEFLMCNGFIAGRADRPDDRIESGLAWRPCDGNATTQPTINGTFVREAPDLKLPPTDKSLATVAQPAYTFTGRTTIQMLTSGKIRITNNGATTDVNPPSNGVIFVKNGTTGACAPYDPLNPYRQSATNYDAAYGVSTACGDAWVSGTYNKDLTIAAENDLIVNGNVISADDARLGLIADGFVRVWHPVNRPSVGSMNCSEPSGSARINGRRIDAAILSLLHSFMVDNYYCGSSLGVLTINGVIAQKFRGAVGTGGTSGGSSTGFDKDYHYNEKLAYKGPPHFLDPVQAAWKLRGFTEQQGSREP